MRIIKLLGTMLALMLSTACASGPATSPPPASMRRRYREGIGVLV